MNSVIGSLLTTVGQISVRTDPGFKGWTFICVCPIFHFESDTNVLNIEHLNFILYEYLLRINNI